ncbi:hypothetical protein [Mesorhizobium sp. M0276]|uniref:hypothetical protein n=1 Tax=Mesorhizobium sp. M0276 TaxID=2956928 RepID=UPI0033399FE6
MRIDLQDFDLKTYGWRTVWLHEVQLRNRAGASWLDLARMHASLAAAIDWTEALDIYEALHAIPLKRSTKKWALRTIQALSSASTTARGGVLSESSLGDGRFFVAFARAKQRVIFTYCVHRGAQKDATLYRLPGKARVPNTSVLDDMSLLFWTELEWTGKRSREVQPDVTNVRHRSKLPPTSQLARSQFFQTPAPTARAMFAYPAETDTSRSALVQTRVRDQRRQIDECYSANIVSAARD